MMAVSRYANIILKNGHKITVPLNSYVAIFIKKVISGVEPDSVNHIYVSGDLMVNVLEIAAICPKEWTEEVEECQENKS